MRALENQIRRVKLSLTRLEARHRRYSWYRLAMFAGSFLLAFAAVFLWNGTAGLVVLGFGLVAFGVLAAVHRAIEKVYLRHRVWVAIKEEHVARALLDWRKIPQTPSPPAPASHPFALDLDLVGPRSVLQLIDTSVWTEGTRKLEEWLTEPSPIFERALDRQGTIRELAPLSLFRDKFLLALRTVSSERVHASKLAVWLSSHVDLTGLRTGLIWASVLFVVNWFLLIGSFVGWFLHPYWEISLAVYFVFHLNQSGRVRPILDSAVGLDDQLSSLSKALAFLENCRCGRHPQLARLCAVFQQRKTRASTEVHRVKILSLLAGLRMNFLTAILLNLALPWDFAVAYLIARERRRLAKLVPAWLDCCAELQALLSLANFAYLNPGCAFPTIDLETDGRFELEARAIGHPLLPPDDRVCNDFSLRDTQVVVLTGSNMSGKSTFIKTLGVNLALAYAGGPVSAESLCVSRFRLFSCIKVTDSVQDHISSFYAEVKRLKALLGALETTDQAPLFYLIDEIFRGTNNRERLIGSRSFMETLIGKNGAGIITTHDLELAWSSEKDPGVRNYHFREEVLEDRMVFDYRLRLGVCPTTNALKIMRMEGLPVKT